MSELDQAELAYKNGYDAGYKAGCKDGYSSGIEQYTEPKIRNWVNLASEKPKRRGHYLVCVQMENGECMVTIMEWFTKFRLPVTHWMELPEPPKEVSE